MSHVLGEILISQEPFVFLLYSKSSLFLELVFKSGVMFIKPAIAY